jgi:hypothetical protein
MHIHESDSRYSSHRCFNKHMYVCVYVNTHVQIHVYVNSMQVTNASIYMYVFVYTHIHMQIQNTLHVCLYVCIYIYTYMYKNNIRMYIHSCTYMQTIYIHTHCTHNHPHMSHNIFACAHGLHGAYHRLRMICSIRRKLKARRLTHVRVGCLFVRVKCCIHTHTYRHFVCDTHRHCIRHTHTE